MSSRRATPGARTAATARPAIAELAARQDPPRPRDQSDGGWQRNATRQPSAQDSPVRAQRDCPPRADAPAQAPEPAPDPQPQPL